MKTRDNGLTYTSHTDIVDARVDTSGAYHRADLYGAYQRPGKQVAPYMVTLTDNRARRVYVMAYGNVPYIIVKGADVILDSVTLDALARMHAASSTYAEALAYVTSRAYAPLAALHAYNDAHPAIEAIES